MSPALSIPPLLSHGLRQTVTVKALVRLIVILLLSGPAVPPAQAAFSSLYVFGDGVSCTASNIYGGSLYYPYTYSNGKVWVQALAESLGLNFNASANPSDLWHDSAYLLGQINQFSAGNANTSLFVVWVCDADFVDDMSYGPYPSLDPTAWNNALNASLTRHSQAITTLYAKGARTLIMPNAVDITKIPYYSGLSASERSFIRGMVTSFNTGLTTVVNQARASLSGLRIYVPDFFTLLDNMVAHPAVYGFINTTSDALDDGYTELNGPGANYLYWDVWDPSAKAHAIVAGTVQPVVQLLTSPPRISKVTSLNGSNRLDVASMPVGLSGFVDGRTNLVLGTWTQMTNFNGTSATQTIFVPASGQRQFYRLRFPYW
jgi:phospholipase/lecithinase/hemolysin